jgi:hypothetical protein
MARKGKPKATTVKRDPNTLVAETKPNEEQAVSLARTTLRPSIKGAVTIKEYSKKYGDLDLMGLVGELSDQAKAANEGNLKRAEGMLMVQAHTLDAIFNNLAQRAINAEYMDNLDRYLRLALKAQSQCRATLETLAAVKNPAPVAFVRQANIANGPQQVNNGVAANASRAGISENQPNKVLEHQHGERLDFGTTGATGSTDSPMETVGAVNRPQDKKG